VQRIGRVRAVVFVAEFLVAAAGSVVLFVLWLFGPLLHGNPTAAALSYGGILVATIVASTVFTARGTTVRGVLLTGGGTLLLGSVISVGVLVLLLAR
jgi:hypothetical protein